MYPGEKQELDLLREQGLRHFQFVRGIAMRVDDNRAKAAITRFRLEGLRETCKEAVAVVRKDHPCET